MNNLFRKNCIDVLSNIRPNSTFLNIKGYLNNNGEIADYNICFHVSYKTALKKSLNIIENYKIENNTQYSKKELLKAKNELINSFKNSLNGKNNQNNYKALLNNKQKPVAGVKIHNKNNSIYLDGFLLTKTITHPVVINKTYKFNAKDYLRNKTPLAKFVQFKLQPNKFDKISVEKKTIKGIIK